MRKLGFTLAAAIAGLPAGLASACPFCGSSTAEQVRTNIFNAEFFYNLAVTLSPFPFLGLVVAFIYLGLPWDRPQRSTARERSHEHYN